MADPTAGDRRCPKLASRPALIVLGDIFYLVLCAIIVYTAGFWRRRYG